MPEYDLALNEMVFDFDDDEQNFSESEHELLINEVESIPDSEINKVDNEVFESVFEPEEEEGDEETELDSNDIPQA
jgi:hypothetical protein